jgi:hypothetical protein
MTQPLRLMSDEQVRLVLEAGSEVPVWKRDRFLMMLAAELAGRASPSNRDVQQALDRALRGLHVLA